MASKAFPSKTLAALLCSLTCTLAAHAQDVVFVQIASQTNPASKDNAKGMAVGIQAYFDAVNAKGGIQGHKLVLVNKSATGMDARADLVIADAIGKVFGEITL